MEYQYTTFFDEEDYKHFLESLKDGCCHVQIRGHITIVMGSTEQALNFVRVSDSKPIRVHTSYKCSTRNNTVTKEIDLTKVLLMNRGQQVNYFYKVASE